MDVLTYKLSNNEQVRVDSLRRAEEKVMIDLINALLYENFLGLREKGVILSDQKQAKEWTNQGLEEQESLFVFDLNQDEKLVFRVYRDVRFNSYKLSRLPVFLVKMEAGNISSHMMQSDQVMQKLCESDEINFPNLEGFCKELNLSIEQTALSLQASVTLEKEEKLSLIQTERLAALRDRPFHPTSRVKNGWDQEEYQRYGSEFGNTFGLDWVAVQKRYIRSGTDSVNQLPHLLLTYSEQETLLRQIKEKELSEEEYMLVPVHPWQMKYIIPQVFKKELAEKIIIPVATDLGTFTASSSVRSLIPVHNPKFHVKVPIGIYSLGALRIQPPRYLENAVQGQKVLQFLKTHHSVLSERLLLCDEEKWLTFFNPDEDSFADKPGHLTCLIRQYPDQMDHTDVLPMSALSVFTDEGEAPLVQFLLNQQDSKDGKELFQEVCHQFIQLALLCCQYGILPELHGQNVALLFHRGKLEQLLLRDHDTVRIFPEWMKQAKTPEVNYVVKPNTRNTLILSSPEEFLSYFQTLGIQVNLASILEAFVKGGYLTEDDGWNIVRDAIRHVISHSIVPDLQKPMSQILLQTEKWPVKEIIAPLLKRAGSGGGSMPSSQGWTNNPLKWGQKK